MIGRWCARGSHRSAQARLYFHFAHGFVARELAYVLDSLVRVSRRVGWYHFVSILASHLRLGPRHGTRQGLKTQDPAGAGLRYLPKSEFPRHEPMLTRPRRRGDADGIGSNRFPFSNFKHF